MPMLLKRAFDSKAQMRFMFAKHPKMAKRMARHEKARGTNLSNLPEKSKHASLVKIAEAAGRISIPITNRGV